MFLNYVRACCTLHNPFFSAVPTFLDHHFSVIQRLPGHQHLAKQLLAFFSLLSLPLFSVIGFFLPSGAG